MADDPRISVETKKKVLKVAEQLGYVGNLPAKMMRGGSSNLIGLILPDVQNDFYASIAQELSGCCDRRGYRMVLSITGDDQESEMRHIRELVRARAAGVIIVPTTSPRRESRSLLKGLPHVQLLRRSSGFGDAWFGIDDESALMAATGHLLAYGHRKIAYIGGSEKLSTGAARVRGVREAFKTAGLSASKLELYLGNPTQEVGESVTRGLLARSAGPTAIISGSVHVTLGILSVVQELKVSVPRELSLVGFGDPIWYAWWGPGLTTVRPPIRSLATACGLWFLDHLPASSQSGEMVAYKSVSPSDLILRGSTGRPPNAK